MRRWFPKQRFPARFPRNRPCGAGEQGTGEQGGEQENGHLALVPDWLPKRWLPTRLPANPAMMEVVGRGQRANHISRRGEICEALAPYVPVEFQDGGDEQVAQVAPPVAKHGHAQTKAFAAQTAELTGESKSTINQYRAIGDALGEDALRVGGTSLDKKAELTALAKMQPEQRAPLIARAIAGEKVTARAPPPPPAAPPPSLALPPTPPRHIRGAGAGRRHALQQSSFGHPCHAGA